MFDEKAFADAGLPSGARGRFVEISAHEKVHHLPSFIMVAD